MAKREGQHHRSPRDVPPVGRPRGAVWRALQADGVIWEGQVQLVGDDLDLAARMIVTHRRVVFVRGGELALDIPRDWLRPEPVLRRDGVLDLFVAMPGADLFAEPMTVPLRMREGHPAAGHIIAMLAPNGVRRIVPETLSGMERAREAAPVPKFNGFWDDDDLGSSWNGAVIDSAEPPTPANEHSSVNGTAASTWQSAAGVDRVIRSSSTPPRRLLTNGFPITGLQPHDQRKSPWGLLFRIGALVLLLATAAALGAGRLNLQPPGGQNSEAILAVPSPTAAAVASPGSPPEAALVPEAETAIAIGVGGSAIQSPDNADSPLPAALQTATGTPPPVATVAPTAAVIPTPASAAAALQGSPEAMTPPAEANGAATSAASPSSSEAEFAAQPAAVAADTAPAQEIVAGPLRLRVSTAQRAESLPRYGLPPGSGEWVLLIVDIRNEGDAPASLAMSDFRLFDREPGATIDLDSGTDVIAGLAGFDPARSATDTIALAAGESTEALLLFLLPPGSSTDVAFLLGESALDLDPVLAAGESAAAAPPELLQATVTGILDGSRIVVDIAGQEATVQYLGMRSPVADACYAAEAIAANDQLVAGETVFLERQASDRGPADVLLRDVWILDQSDAPVLVASRLLEAGAGAAAPAAPDTRYQAWLQAASALARTNGAGMWSACPEAVASADQAPANEPAIAFLAGSWRVRWGSNR